MIEFLSPGMYGQHDGRPLRAMYPRLPWRRARRHPARLSHLRLPHALRL